VITPWRTLVNSAAFVLTQSAIRCNGITPSTIYAPRLPSPLRPLHLASQTQTNRGVAQENGIVEGPIAMSNGMAGKKCCCSVLRGLAFDFNENRRNRQLHLRCGSREMPSYAHVSTALTKSMQEIDVRHLACFRFADTR